MTSTVAAIRAAGVAESFLLYDNENRHAQVHREVRRAFVPGFLGETEPYLIVELYFESATATAVSKSPEWRAAGANLAEIGGMELVAMFTADALDD